MKAEGEYIAVNELYGSVTGATASVAKALRYNGRTGRRALLNGIIKYDHWITTLSAENFSIPANGGNVSEYIKAESYGLDCDNEKHDMEYTISPTSISSNNTTSAKSHTITVLQAGTGKSVSVTATQAANVQTTTYQNFRITSLTYSDVPAGGGYVYPSIKYAYDKVVTNTSGGSTTTTQTGSVSSCKITSYSTSSSYIGDVYTSDGRVYASSLYTTPKSRSSVALIYGISITVNVGGENRTIEYSSSKYVYQQANAKSAYSTGYTVDLTTSKTTMDAVGGSVTLTVKPYQVTYYKWTSGLDGGSSSSIASSKTVTLSRTSGNGTLSKTSITGQGTATYSMYSNDDEYNAITHVIKASISSSVYDTVSITQSKGVYEFYFEDPSPISYAGGTYDIELVSRLNGELCEVIEETVTLDGEAVDSVTYSDSSDVYKVQVTFPKNTSTSSTKSYTLEAQQYSTGKTVTLTITQAKQTSSSVTGSVTISNLVNGLYVDGLSLYGFNSYPQFTITASGGTLSACVYAFCLYFEIQTSSNEYAYTYEHELEYIQITSLTGSKTVYFADFPGYFNFEELLNGVIDPYDTIESIVVGAELKYVSGTGRLTLGGSISDYTWYV